jgi:protein involved in sex pheromone biosynthesis
VKKTLKTMALMGVAVLLSGGLALAADKTETVKSKSSRAQQSVTTSVADPIEFDGNQNRYVLPMKPNQTRRLRYDPSRMASPRNDARPDCDDLSLIGALARSLGLVEYGQACNP